MTFGWPLPPRLHLEAVQQQTGPLRLQGPCPGTSSGSEMLEATGSGGSSVLVAPLFLVLLCFRTGNTGGENEHRRRLSEQQSGPVLLSRPFVLPVMRTLGPRLEHDLAGESLPQDLADLEPLLVALDLLLIVPDDSLEQRIHLGLVGLQGGEVLVFRH